MSIKISPSTKDVVPQGYIVAAPKTSDIISGALRAAFGRQDPQADDFSALLRQIDLADRNSTRC